MAARRNCSSCWRERVVYVSARSVSGRSESKESTELVRLCLGDSVGGWVLFCMMMSNNRSVIDAKFAG